MGQLTCLQQFADFNCWCRANRTPSIEIFAPERLKPSLLKIQTGPHKGVMEFCKHLSSRWAQQNPHSTTDTAHQTWEIKMCASLVVGWVFFPLFLTCSCNYGSFNAVLVFSFKFSKHTYSFQFYLHKDRHFQHGKKYFSSMIYESCLIYISVLITEW